MNTESSSSRRLVELTSFVAAAPARPGGDGPERRFTRLLADDGASVRTGATSTVSRVENAAGEAFALKVLRPAREGASPALMAAREDAFYEEYRNQLVVSGLRGFPEVFGFGRAGGRPAILMEWIECASLHQVERDAGVPWDGGRVARLGAAVAAILDSTSALDRGFVHRDLSPRNIVLRTSSTSVTDQLETGEFDVCLVDMGSSVALSDADGSFTMLADVWRNGTPDYAPPEMLTRDVTGIDELRHSPAVDVYALCSVLYELYAGFAPFRVSEHPEASPYRLKMDTSPAPLRARSSRDEGLCAIVMAGLARDPEGRPTVASLRAALEAWVSGDAGAEALLAPFGGTPPEGAENGASGEKDGASGDAPGTRRAVSRRALLAGAGAVAAVGVVAAATGGFGLVGSGSRRFPDLTWDDIAEVSAEIADAGDEEAAIEVARRHGICDEDGLIDRSLVKPLVIAGAELAAQVAGIAHDVRADGSPIGLTFLLTSVMPEQRAMADEAYQGGWETSGMRSWMAGDLLDQLPEELARNLVAAAKLTNNVGPAQDAGDVTVTEDLLWLPSYCELVGARDRTSFSENYQYLADVLNAEGSQYKLFRDQGLLARGDYEPLVRERGGVADYWWLRSASPDVSLSEGMAYFNRTAPNGDPFHYATACTDASGVLFGFCV